MFAQQPKAVRGAPRSLLGEGPVWDDKNEALYWVDIDKAMLHAYFPGSSKVKSFVLKESASCVALCSDGRLLLALKQSLALFDPKNSELKQVKSVDVAERVRFNDGKCDGDGRFWVGTMDVEEREPIGALYVVEAGFKMRKALGDVTISNGIGWSPDYGEMYYVDSPTRKVSVFRYDEEKGELHGMLKSVDLSFQHGVPDGLTVDSEGKIWVAIWEGSCILRVDPATSKVLSKIELPVPRVTSCTFGGKHLDTLIITTAQNERGVGGELYSVETGVKGIPTDVFEI